MQMSPSFPGIEEALSADRFGTYLRWARGDRERALALYALNTRLSESLYVPLQMLEITLRNRIDGVLSAHAGPTWFDLPQYQLNARQSGMIASARTDLSEAKKPETPGAVVAAVTFGYWTSLLGKEYENLWQICLHRIARRTDGKGLRRKDFAAPLGPIRMLRNRVAHHEPILHWDLPKHHTAIVQLTEWLMPVAAEWTAAIDRFDQLYPVGGIELVGG
jgi:hypothetical protein